MICLAIGLGVLGIAAMRRARRCNRGEGGWHRHHYGHHGRRHWMLHYALRRIDASPAQERVIADELDKLEDRVWTARRNLRDSKQDLAAAIRGPVMDDAALGALLGAVDAATGDIRSAGIEALRGIHTVLDDGQRARLADMLTRDAGPWGRGSWRSGPYR